MNAMIYIKDYIYCYQGKSDISNLDMRSYHKNKVHFTSSVHHMTP